MCARTQHVNVHHIGPVLQRRASKERQKRNVQRAHQHGVIGTEHRHPKDSVSGIASMCQPPQQQSMRARADCRHVYVQVEQQAEQEWWEGKGRENLPRDLKGRGGF